jgi:hypothetical protein
MKPALAMDIASPGNSLALEIVRMETTVVAELACGDLLDKGPDHIVLSLPGTDYRLHLHTPTPVKADVGKRIRGRIHAQARRVDVVTTGGCFIDPVYGRPRRLQGHVMAVDPEAGTLTVQCGCAMVATLMAPQKPTDFSLHDLVALDIQRGATFQERG